MIHEFKNIGFLRTRFSFETLRDVLANIADIRADYSKAKPSYWPGSGLLEHEYMVSDDSHRQLEQLIAPHLQEFQDSLENMLGTSAPLRQKLQLGCPWVQIRQPHECVPVSSAGGVYNWLLWVGIPKAEPSRARMPTTPGSVDLIYSNTMGVVKTHRLEPKEGSLILWPSQIQIVQYPNLGGETVTIMGAYKQRIQE
jgi:hypothetical protein